MKSIQHQLLSTLSSPSGPISLLSSSIATSSCIASERIDLSQEELTEINLLIPRLCCSNNLPLAIELIDTALAANPPLKSISFSILVDCLVSQPDMTQPMSLLTRLKHNPRAHPSLLPINTMLISSYFNKGKLKEAWKVFNWRSRPGSPCFPDADVNGIVAAGYCRNGISLKALKVVRAMVESNCLPQSDLRRCVYKCLLREARLREAKELDWALGYIEIDRVEGLKKALELLDQMISNWTD